MLTTLSFSKPEFYTAFLYTLFESAFH